MQDDWTGEALPQFITCLTKESSWLEIDLADVSAILWGEGNQEARLILTNGLVISVAHPKTKEQFRAAWRSAKRNKRYG